MIIPAMTIMSKRTSVSPRQTWTVGSPLHQRYHVAADKIVIAPKTKRLYPSNALVRNKPPASCPPHVLNTAGITAPMSTSKPPTHTPRATNSRVRHATMPERDFCLMRYRSAWLVSNATRPPTIVVLIRPFTFQPANGVFRLFDRNFVGSTSHDS